MHIAELNDLISLNIAIFELTHHLFEFLFGYLPSCQFPFLLHDIPLREILLDVCLVIIHEVLLLFFANLCSFVKSASCDVPSFLLWQCAVFFWLNFFLHLLAITEDVLFARWQLSLRVYSVRHVLLELLSWRHWVLSN